LHNLSGLMAGMYKKSGVSPSSALLGSCLPLLVLINS
jgi:hypothetical protein